MNDLTQSVSTPTPTPAPLRSRPVSPRPATTLFSQWLRNERSLRAISQKSLAESLSISPFTILRWEKGQTHPQPDMTQRLAQYFSIAPWVLEVLAQRPPVWLQQAVIAQPAEVEAFCSSILEG